MPDTALHVGSGKVRELYALDEERLLLVASDRISTFDVVLPTDIPDKGRVLTGLAGFWFARTQEICSNHLIALRSDGRSTECRRLEMLPIECVVRGYLAGSGWKEYRRPAPCAASRCRPGCARPTGCRSRSSRPRQGRDRPRREHLLRAGRELIGGGAGRRGRATYARDLPARRATTRDQRGIIIADTKFEFGLDDDGSSSSSTRC